jgi:hypothetical protein
LLIPQVVHSGHFKQGEYHSRQKHPTPPTPNPRTEISSMAPRGPGFPLVAEEPLFPFRGPATAVAKWRDAGVRAAQRSTQIVQNQRPQVESPQFAHATDAQEDRSLATLIFDCANGSVSQPQEVSAVAHVGFYDATTSK